MALLDTTVFVDLGGRGGSKKKAEAQQILRQLLASGESLCTSRVNIAELYVGLEISDDPDHEQEAIDDYLTWTVVLELDDASARYFGRIRADLQKRGRLVGDLDILIAAIALAHNHPVITRNPAHFSSMPGVRVVSYGI